MTRHEQDTQSAQTSSAAPLLITLADSIRSVAIVVDGLKIQHLNDEACRILGVDVEQRPLEDSVLGLIRSESWDAFHEQIEHVQATGQALPPFLCYWGQSSSSAVALDTIVLPIGREQQSSSLIIGVALEGDALLNRIVAEAEHRYSPLLDAITEACFIISHDWTFTFVNLAASRVTRLRQDKLLGKGLLELSSEIENTLLHKAFALVMDRRQAVALMWSGTILPQGIAGEFEIRVYPIAEGILVMAHDITDRVRAERSEREQRILSEALRDTAAAVNSSLELDEVLDRILANIERVVDHKAANIMLTHDSGRYARVVRSRGYQQAQEATSAEADVFEVETVSVLKEMAITRKPLIIPDVTQSNLWIEANSESWIRSYAGSPIQAQGELLGFINLDSGEKNTFSPDHVARLAAFADQAAIAIRNARLYETLKENASELETRNKELDAFSYTVAHDLRHPLQLIIGYVDLLRSAEGTPLSKESQGYVEIIAEFSQKMNLMINNLLLLATIRDAQQVVGHVEMRPVIAAIERRYGAELKESGVQLIIGKDLPAVIGFEPWIEEVMANLVENAIKYRQESKQAWIRVEATRQGDIVRYSVSDNGIGIRQEDQGTLFDAFARISQRAGGLGLGLSIVNRIVARLGGTVGVDSKPGEGSTFWFTLPSATSDRPISV